MFEINENFLEAKGLYKWNIFKIIWKLRGTTIEQIKAYLEVKPRDAILQIVHTCFMKGLWYSSFMYEPTRGFSSKLKFKKIPLYPPPLVEMSRNFNIKIVQK